MTYDPGASDNVRAMLRRATILGVDDGGTQQLVHMRGLAGEEFTKVYRAQPHGLSSVPPKESEALLLTLGGRSDRAVMIGGEHRDRRPKGLPAGAVAIYGADGEIVSLVQRAVRVVGETVRVVASERCVIESPRTDIGGEGGAKVMTEAGPSSKLYAVV